MDATYVWSLHEQIEGNAYLDDETKFGLLEFVGRMTEGEAEDILTEDGTGKRRFAYDAKTDGELVKKFKDTLFTPQQQQRIQRQRNAAARNGTLIPDAGFDTLFPTTYQRGKRYYVKGRQVSAAKYREATGG